MLIRPTTAADQPHLKSLMETVWQGDEGAVLYHRAGRVSGFVAEVDGQLAGYAHLGATSLHPTFEYVGVHVRPEFQRQGIGGRLWQEVVRGQTKPLKTATYAHLPGAVAFLERRGLSVVMETHMPTLNPATVEAESVRGWVVEAEAAGFDLRPMSLLVGKDVRRRVTRLHMDVYAHTHEHDPPSRKPEDEAEQDFLGDDLRPEWLWVAERDGALAGVGSVRDMGDPAEAELGWFGVTKHFAEYGRTLTLALTGLALRRAAGEITRITPELDSADPNARSLLEALPWKAGKVWLTLRSFEQSRGEL